MSDADLIKALRAQVAVQLPAVRPHESTRMLVHRNEFLKAEARRLTPILERLIAVVEACQMLHDEGDLQPEIAEPLASLRAAVLPQKPKYNWESTGPGGCDSHNVEHPCGRCLGAKRE